MANIIYRNQANKIFIYNSPEEVVDKANICIDDEDVERKNTSSITILTSGTIPLGSEYHIRIKNNFKNEKTRSSTDGYEEVVTDQKMQPAGQQNGANDLSPYRADVYEMDEDVLLRSLDGKLYLGTIVKIQNGKYLVKFDDNTEKWATERGLKKLNCSNKSEHRDEPLCVVCKVKNESDVVEVCNKCSRGYHRHCLNKTSNFSSPWCCDRCTASEIISISDSEDNDSAEKANLELSYDIETLQWDKLHRENDEQTYCYCGKGGSWNIQMLQCIKCQQWFHKNCIMNWKGRLMNGDNHYMFACKICNKGKELLARCTVKWKSFVAGIFYELTTLHGERSFSLSKDVIPLVWDDWDLLIVPFARPKSKGELRELILDCVKDEPEFKVIGGNKRHKSDFVRFLRKMPLNCTQRITVSRDADIAKDLRFIKKMETKFRKVEEIEVPSQVEVSKIIKNHDTLTRSKEKNRRKRRFNENTEEIQVLPSPDDDSSDENSSKSALDWIIPAPSNFHGKNNPFHSQYKFNSKQRASDRFLKRGQQTIFEKLPEIRIVRTIKRRLNANDIAFSSSRDAKRRKFMKRRKSCDVEIISEVIQPMSWPKYLPVRGIVDQKDGIKSTAKHRDGDFKDVTNILYNKSSRMQRSRRASHAFDNIDTSPAEGFKANDQTSSSISLNDVVINSPIKNKSINLYFGAINRIENGEKFTIVAKRLTFDGKEQYLTEWNTTSVSSIK